MPLAQSVDVPRTEKERKGSLDLWSSRPTRRRRPFVLAGRSGLRTLWRACRKMPAGRVVPFLLLYRSLMLAGAGGGEGRCEAEIAARQRPEEKLGVDRRARRMYVTSRRARADPAGACPVALRQPAR